MHNMRSYWTFPLSTQLNRVHLSSRTENHPRELKIENCTPRGSASFSKIDESWSNPRSTDRWHSQSWVSHRYPQSHDKLHQLTRGWRSHSPPIQLRSVDATLTTWAQGHRQKDNIPSLRPYHDRLFCCQITSQVCQHHRNLIHAIPSREHCLHDNSLDGQVWVGNFQVWPHANSTEEMGRVQAVFGQHIVNYGIQ